MRTKIKHYRELKHWSQEDLAREAKVSRTTISGLENETIQTITNSTMNKIANALEVSVIELFFT